jgi:hypothetical protein
MSLTTLHYNWEEATAKTITGINKVNFDPSASQSVTDPLMGLLQYPMIHVRHRAYGSMDRDLWIGGSWLERWE